MLSSDPSPPPHQVGLAGPSTSVDAGRLYQLLSAPGSAAQLASSLRLVCDSFIGIVENLSAEATQAAQLQQATMYNRTNFGSSLSC